MPQPRKHTGKHEAGRPGLHASAQAEPAAPPERERMVLIVVGARLESEIAERPLAAELRDAIERCAAGAAMGDELPGDADEAMTPVVCTDVWYLNDPSLSGLPVICIGPPEHNAATAYFASKLPTAFVVEGSYRVQLDPEWLDLTVCIWGVRTSDTAAGVRLFCERYLEEFMRAAREGS